MMIIREYKGHDGLWSLQIELFLQESVCQVNKLVIQLLLTLQVRTRAALML